MATIERYVLEDSSGHQHDRIFDTITDAQDAASHYDAVAIVALQFEFEDSELVEVWRYGRKTDEESWPA